MRRILTFSTLYPNSVDPGRGIFVENRIRKLYETGKIVPTIVAPVPWFPFKMSAFPRYSSFCSVPSQESRFGLDVYHPRYLVLPKVSMSIVPALMHAGVRSLVRSIAAEKRIELIDAHYFYPDGVTAVLLGRELNIPVTVTARGSDLNVLPSFPGPRRWMRLAARHSARLFTVSDAQVDILDRLGVPPEKVEVLRNGVDLAVFRPNETEQRNKVPTVLSVGRLDNAKGHDIAIQAIATLEAAKLRIIGEGEQERSLRHLASKLGLDDRVEFLPRLDQKQLARAYASADVLVLATEREGMPNVVLESIACGTPVVATSVGGLPEVVSSYAAGILVQDRSPQAFATALKTVLSAPPSRAETRRHAEKFGWEVTIRKNLSLIEEIVANP